MLITEGKWVDLFVTYKFLRVLTTAWEDQEAFKLGIIDKDGKRIKSKKNLTTDEKDEYTMLHRLVFNFKRILHKIPLVKSKIGTYAAALYLLKEEMESEEYNTLLEYLESHKALSGVRKLTEELTKTKAICLLGEDNMTTEIIKEIEEDVPANNMGDGNVAVKDAPFTDDEKSKKVDGRTKTFKEIMRRIRERKLKEEERAIKAKLRAMGISESMLEGTESTVQEGSDVEGETYKEYFAKCLKKFGAKSPAELEGKKKVEFFKYVDDNWAAAVEKD